MRKKLIILGLVAGFVLYLDQMAKALAVIHLKDNPPITVVEGNFDLVYVENTGAAFGLFSGASKDFRFSKGI
jgi:signal peptidase II